MFASSSTAIYAGLSATTLRRPARARTLGPTRAAVGSVIPRPASSDDASSSTSSSRVLATPSSRPIVIAPGFGNDSRDYQEALGRGDASLVQSLTSRGFAVHVARVERKDWFIGILKSILTRGFWLNACTTTESYGWYLARLDDAVQQALEANPDALEVDIVAHSAGGWLARAYIGGALALVTTPNAECSASGLSRNARVRSLISLGTPHVQDAKADPTRGACKWVNDTWPGTYFASDGVKYVCVAGRAVVGDVASEKGSITRYASGSYAVVAGGDGNGVCGDAVVPNSAALALEGAENVVLDGVWHSMSTVGTFDAPAAYPWYGSDDIVDSWLAKL